MMKSPLLSLPLELRREVWRLVLLAPRRLRPMQGSNQGLLPRLVKVADSIALLGACRQIYDEALDILYQCNLFHLTPMSLPQRHCIESSRFHLIQHVNLEFTFKDFTRDSRDARLTHNIRDSWLAISILRLAALCPRLKTCTIIFSEPTIRRIGSCLAAGTQTAMAIACLNSRSISERLEVITELSTYSQSFIRTQPIPINEFLLSIAPASNWSCDLSRSYGVVQIQARWNHLQHAHKLSRPEMVGDSSKTSVHVADCFPQLRERCIGKCKSLASIEGSALRTLWPHCLETSKQLARDLNELERLSRSANGY